MKNRRISVPLVIVSVLLIMVIAWFIYYYLNTSGRISVLQHQLSSAGSQISSLESQLSSSRTQITTLQNQTTTLQNQISDLQSIVNLSRSSTKADSVKINQSAGQLSLVVTFRADYAGYLIVGGTSTTPNGIIYVTDSFIGYPYSNYALPFGTGGTLIIPVLPGTVTVYFGNTNLFGAATATISVLYFY